MWNARNRRRKAEGRRQPRGAWRLLRAAAASRRFAYCLLLTAFCLLSAGCRMDMQDQPKYKTFRAGDGKFGVSGASVRPLVEGTVPRQSGGAYRDREDYFYTGKTPALPGGGAQSGAQGGGAGASVPNAAAGAAASSP